jgi:hypothetical protein
MNAEPEEILAALGYRLEITELSLPLSDRALTPGLEQRIRTTLPLVSLTSEAARRETLVAPILLEVVTYCQAQLRIEYPLTVNNWLKGTLDYLLRAPRSFVVVEAKNDDLTRGFTQLAAELIALAHVQEVEILYGAVTIGDAWRFGKLDALHHTITQDITLFTVPDNLDKILRIVIGILEG